MRAAHQSRSSVSQGAVAALIILALQAGGSTASAAPVAESPAGARTLVHKAADDLGVRDAEVDAAAAQLAGANRQLDTARRDAAQASARAASLRRELAARRRTLARALSSQVVSTEQADTAEQRVRDTRSQSKAALRSLYTQSPSGLQAFAQGGSLTELSDRVNLLDSVAAARTRRLDARRAAYQDAAAQQQAKRVATNSAQSAAAAVDEQARQASGAAAAALQAEQRVETVRGGRQRTLAAFRAAAVAARRRYETQRAASDRIAALLVARAAQTRAASDRIAALLVARAAQTRVASDRTAALQAAQARRAAAERSAALQAARAEQATRAAQPSASLPEPTGGGAPASIGTFTLPTDGALSSVFGYRDDPFGLGRRFHAGQDFSAPLGTPIVAAAAGTVALVQTPEQSGGYGNYTCIDHGSGLSTCYAHQSGVLVRVGQQVQQGELIGLVGSTGASTGAHLHFEVRIDGTPVDPMPYLP